MYSRFETCTDVKKKTNLPAPNKNTQATIGRKSDDICPHLDDRRIVQLKLNLVSSHYLGVANVHP